MICILFAFLFGLGIGSFLNVVIARLPFEKSLIWPGSRCFTCFRSLRFGDNLPIIGYLRLRGRCRFCGAHFSSRYLWIELLTGLMFVGVFLLEIVYNYHGIPGLANAMGWPGNFPHVTAICYYAALVFFFSLLIAASTIDLHYRIIPGQITYLGTLIGLVISTLAPWPWPSSLEHLPPQLPGGMGWMNPLLQGRIPMGLALWPFWEPPDWAPAGSWQLGLLTGLIGAAVGQFIGRSVKLLFEMGFQRDALGLGDADLLMMIGSFLGWQIAVLALPAGAFVLLPLLIPWMIFKKIRDTFRGSDQTQETPELALPFGPGIAAGAVVCWLMWPELGEAARFFFFSPLMLTMSAVIVGGGLLIFGVLLRRGPEPTEATQ